MHRFFYTQLFQVGADGNTGTGLELSGKIARTGIYQRRQLFHTDLLLQMPYHPILYRVDIIIDMTAVLHIDAVLWLRSIPADIYHHFPRNPVSEFRTMPL